MGEWTRADWDVSIANHRLYEAEDVTYSATLVRPSNTAGNARETIQLKVADFISYS